jgi:hypothetical protein
VTCSHPSCTQPHDNWPDGSPEGLLCQAHWDIYSSCMWWKDVIGLDRAGLIEPQAD